MFKLLSILGKTLRYPTNHTQAGVTAYFCRTLYFYKVNTTSNFRYKEQVGMCLCDWINTKLLELQ